MTFDQIPVKPYHEIPHNGIRSGSALFRTNTGLPTVLNKVLKGYGPSLPDELSVLSVGSSFGPEADSIMAYLTIVAPEIGKVSLTGIDINPTVVDQAKAGKYWTESRHHKSVTALCRAVSGITSEPAAAEQLDDGKGWLIDTNNLRAAFDVQFLCHDLGADEMALPPADVIFCNNVLFYVDPETADGLVGAMIKGLNPGGTLSFEANPRQNPADLPYIQWRQVTAENLQAQGITPTLWATNLDLPHAFQKAA